MGGDKQLVFVQYGEFYEPVPVKTGATQGELIEITEGLSVGEKLVTQGSLSLYAESRKTPTAETETKEPVVAEAAENTAPAETTSMAPNETQASPPVAAEPGLPVLPIALGGLGVIGAGILGLRAFNLSRKGKNFFGK